MASRRSRLERTFIAAVFEIMVVISRSAKHVFCEEAHCKNEEQGIIVVRGSGDA